MIAAHLLNPSRSYAAPDDAVGEYLAKRLAARRRGARRRTAADAPRRARPPRASRADRPVCGRRIAARARARAYGSGRHRRRRAPNSPNCPWRSMRRSCGCKTRSSRSRARRSISARRSNSARSFSKSSGCRTAAARRPAGRPASRCCSRSRASTTIVAKVLEYREYTKLKNTYVDVIPKLVGSGRPLANVFNQTTTATGRLSSTNPNLQNVPVRTDLGRRVRRAFVAPPGRTLLAADYSQIELRIMAHLSGDEAMRAAFSRGDDIHDVTARGIFAVAPDDGRDAEPAAHREIRQFRLALRHVRFRPRATFGDRARGGARDDGSLLRALPARARMDRAQPRVRA